MKRKKIRKPGRIFLHTTQFSYAELSCAEDDDKWSVDLCICEDVSTDPRRLRVLAGWLLRVADWMEQERKK